MSVEINRPDQAGQLTNIFRPTGIVPTPRTVGSEVIFSFPFLEGSRVLQSGGPFLFSQTGAAGSTLVLDALPAVDPENRPIWWYVVAANARHNDGVVRDIGVVLHDPNSGISAALSPFPLGTPAGVRVAAASKGVALGQTVAPIKLAALAVTMGAGAQLTLDLCAIPYLFGEPHLRL